MTLWARARRGGAAGSSNASRKCASRAWTQPPKQNGPKLDLLDQKVGLSPQRPSKAASFQLRLEFQHFWGKGNWFELRKLLRPARGYSALLLPHTETQPLHLPLERRDHKDMTVSSRRPCGHSHVFSGLAERLRIGWQLFSGRPQQA